MNKQQAKRIALAMNGASLIRGELPAICFQMSDADFTRISKATEQMGWDMLERAGFDGDAPDIETILSAVLGKHSISIEPLSLDRFRK